MEPTIRQPDPEAHLLRLLVLNEQVLDACDLRPGDIGEARPYDCILELKKVAVSEGDLPTISRLTAALEFAAVLNEATAAWDQGCFAELAEFVTKAEACVERVTARRLEVVRG